MEPDLHRAEHGDHACTRVNRMGRERGEEGRVGFLACAEEDEFGGDEPAVACPQGAFGLCGEIYAGGEEDVDAEVCEDSDG